MVEMMLGVMSAFHAHKWILQAASCLLWTFSRILLSFSYSPFPAFTALGLCLLFIGIFRLQDQEDVNGAVSDDSEDDVDEAEQSTGDDSPMEKDSTETEVDQEGEEEVDQEDEEEVDQEMEEEGEGVNDA